ncbi:hypothetical protein [Fischerella sp.]|nr:hypothetical protein [Fischerella sp.]
MTENTKPNMGYEFQPLEISFSTLLSDRQPSKGNSKKPETTKFR